MGKKRIKHLKGRRSTGRMFRRILSVFFIIIVILFLLVGLKYVTEMYKAKNIEDSKIEFYMDIADEVGKEKAQLNWKELLAIDMIIYNGDLSNVKKSDVLGRAKKFLKYSEDKYGKWNYTLKAFNEVLDECNFNKEQKSKANKNLNKLKYVFLGNKKLTENSPEIIFINKIKGRAIENYEEYGILPSITIAQCILESGWGNSELAKKSNNLFGIKADLSWDGESINLTTSENYNDKVVAAFRSYTSIEESIKDHGEFLKENQRYEKSGLFSGKCYVEQAQALEDAGYSTKEDKYGNKTYANMLINLIRRYNLQLIDCNIYRNN